MSHELLLRLFLSPTYFSVYVALHYLTVYHSNIGITYYLTKRLEEIDLRELCDVWNFICHLLVSRPSKSRALEAFVVGTCEKSTHLVLSTLWFMQAYLQDLTNKDISTLSFTVCQRVLHRCHEIIFEGAPDIKRGPYSEVVVPSLSYLLRRRVRPRLEPALVGIGCILAGAPGLPNITNIVGNIALEQGRATDDLEAPRSVEEKATETTLHDSANNVAESQQYNDVRETEDFQEQISENDSNYSITHYLDHKLDMSDSPSSLSQVLTRPAFTSPVLPMRRTLTQSNITERLSDELLTLSHQSSPSISTSKHTPESVVMSKMSMYKGDLSSQSRILRVHYCRSEIQFISALGNISARLLTIPKPARVSALRAELVSLNHKLPAEICLPLWCDSSDNTSICGSGRAHHRIVRVPPGESVVLNSADRVPFLILVEILNDTLDFDPSKTKNKEIIKKVVENRQDISVFPSFNGREMRRRTQSSVDVNEELVQSRSLAELKPSVPDSFVNDNDDEIDVVEQIYGPEFSVRQAPEVSYDVSSLTRIKNRALDDANWSQSVSEITPPDNKGATHMVKMPWSFFSVLFSDTRPPDSPYHSPVVSLDEYTERMEMAAVMLAQLNSSSPDPSSSSSSAIRSLVSLDFTSSEHPLNWIFKSGQSPGPVDMDHINVTSPKLSSDTLRLAQPYPTKLKLDPSEAASIRDRIMGEMMALEEERVRRMRDFTFVDEQVSLNHGAKQTIDDESIVRRELSKTDPSAVVLQEPWSKKKSRIRQASPYGHLASWDCVSVIVKTGADLRQEELAVQLVREFQRIWQEENCVCWVRYFRILITGSSSGLIETINDSISIHSLKKAEYSRRLAQGRFSRVTLLDHFVSSYGEVSSAKFIRAQRNFIRSLAGYSIVTYLLQIKDRHNGNILLDRDGHLIHIDFGFMLSNSPGNMGFEAAPFKLPFEYVEVMGGLESPMFMEYKQLFHRGFDAARKHSDRIITIVELMQKSSSLPCFVSLGEQCSQLLKDRFQLTLSQSAVHDYYENLIIASTGSSWTRLYDTYQYYTQSIL